MKRWFLNPAIVESTSVMSPRFCTVDLGVQTAKPVNWMPGQQIQIGIGTGFENRTYTPISCDAETGRTQLLIYLHGNSPGCRWAQTVQSGDTTFALGPRRSLDVSGPAQAVVVVGDETCWV
jgi:NADPH-dependent ferric siderophore reductase